MAELGQFIRNLREDFGLTILLVEHHMSLVMGISDRVHVLDFGSLSASGTPAEVQQDARVIERPATFASSTSFRYSHALTLGK